VKYDPSPWGREFHSLHTDEALGGGSAGPGKSLALLMDPLEQLVVEHERCKVGEVRWGQSAGWALHLRREFPRLEQTIHRSKLLFDKLDPGAKYDSTTHKWRFSSGYQYQFGHLKDGDSFLNYRSNEYTWLGVDEIGELDSKDPWDELVLRVRSVDPVLSKMLKARATSNPSANWVREYFVDPAPQGRVIFGRKIRLEDGSEIERTRMFLPARLSDNPNAEFRRQYEANLRDKPPHIRAALLDGDWYVVAGAFFADLWDPLRVLVKPFKIPSGWRRFRSGDWGYKQQCVILWWAVTPEGELICYRERTFNGPKAKTLYDAIGVAEQIREIEKTNSEWNFTRNCSRLNGFMDTQLWEERGHRGPTMADDMAQAGVYWQKATKGRRQAAQQIVKRLRQRGYNDRPGLMFFENCIKCISTIPALATDDVDPEVPRKGGPDHWYDAVSYAVAANPLPSGREDARDDDDEADEAASNVNRGRYGYGGA
jgi:hypothetical protein